MLVALGLRRDVIDYRLARGESATEWERFLADFAADLNDVIPSDLFVRHTEPLAIMSLGRPCCFLPSTSESGSRVRALVNPPYFQTETLPTLSMR